MLSNLFYVKHLTYVIIIEEKFAFIERVDKDRITTVKDLESWRFER